MGPDTCDRCEKYPTSMVDRDLAQAGEHRNGLCPHCGQGAIFGRVERLNVAGTNTIRFWVCLNCGHKALRVSTRPNPGWTVGHFRSGTAP